MISKFTKEKSKIARNNQINLKSDKDTKEKANFTDSKLSKSEIGYQIELLKRQNARLEDLVNQLESELTAILADYYFQDDKSGPVIDDSLSESSEAAPDAATTAPLTKIISEEVKFLRNQNIKLQNILQHIRL